MNWTYLGKKYKTVKIDWKELHDDWKINLEDWILENYPKVSMKEGGSENTSKFYRFVLYHTKWDRCYTPDRFGVFGSGSSIKFGLYDIYKGNKRIYYTQAKFIELVVEVD